MDASTIRALQQERRKEQIKSLKSVEEVEKELKEKISRFPGEDTYRICLGKLTWDPNGEEHKIIRQPFVDYFPDCIVEFHLSSICIDVVFLLNPNEEEQRVMDRQRGRETPVVAKKSWWQGWF